MSILVTLSSWPRSIARGSASVLFAAAEVVSQGGAADPEIVILEVVPPGDVLEAVAHLRAEYPGSKVVVLGPSADNDTLLAVLRAGVSGWLADDTEADSLVRALKAIVGGEVAIPRSCVPRLVEEMRSRPPVATFRLAGDRTASLTRRESDVLELLSEGKSTEQISEQLFVSKATVRSHVSSILAKLGVEDREAAVNVLTAHQTSRIRIG